ncbi:MAG: DUF72 domain-containing protein [Thermoprotei archaeon]|nr:MAG: DUF72 domain-containing protein [Thermoprotei archaeon]
MVVRIGCCGWAVRGGMKKYFETFEVVELQSTFYKLPTLETAQRWREEAPSDFIYTMKAWQAITHPPTSPTWRKSGLKVSREEADKYGLLKPTEENYQAWKSTIEIAKAIKCRVLVIQLPPSFTNSEENINNMRTFMESVERPRDIVVGVEFRDESWNLSTVRSLCEDLDLVHVVDPFRQQSATLDQEIIYYRLHGLGKRAYVYDYSMEELKELYEKWVKPFEEEKEVYVLFNNTNMANDALDFKGIISSKMA